MQLFTPLGDVGHVIQLAIAPVFLLTAVGAILNVLTGRLARAVDRRRLLVARLAQLDAAALESANAELYFLERRGRLIYTSIALAVICALLICLLIAVAFLDALVRDDFATLVAVLFMLAMLALIGSLGCFLREVFLGVNTARSPVL
jgi:hypothetical protein